MTIDNSIMQLISFLTSPLILTHAPATILSLQLYLQATFSSFTAPILTLSPSSSAPPQIYYACLASGVSWEDWITVLCPDGRPVQLLISKAAIHARKSGLPGLLTIWRAKDDEHLTLVPISKTSTDSSFRARLQAALSSARTRRRADEDDEPMAIRIPTLLQATHDDEDSDSESDSDSDSIFSYASRDSMSSATTLSSMSSYPGTSPQVDLTKKTVTKYMYQGGVTKVMTGGVMLGKPASPSTSVAAKYVAPKPTLVGKAPARSSRAASNADSWRRTVGATA